MEEQKIEDMVTAEKKAHCHHKMMFMKGHHGCCGHKIVRVLILAVIILGIFSVGVCVGAHKNRGFKALNQRSFGSERHFGAGRMIRSGNCQGRVADGLMAGCQNKGAINNGSASCRFQESNTQVNTAPCPMMRLNQATQATPAQVQAPASIPAPVITVTPVK